MKYFRKLNTVMKHFTIWDIGVLKVCLFAIGVLAGVYFFSFFDRILFGVWIVFVLAWVYIVVKVFGMYWDKE